jgi:hypothetical protein
MIYIYKQTSAAKQPNAACHASFKMNGSQLIAHPDPKLSLGLGKTLYSKGNLETIPRNPIWTYMNFRMDFGSLQVAGLNTDIQTAGNQPIQGSI